MGTTDEEVVGSAEREVEELEYIEAVLRVRLRDQMNAGVAGPSGTQGEEVAQEEDEVDAVSRWLAGLGGNPFQLQ